MKKFVLAFTALSALSMIGMLFFNQGNLYSNGGGAPSASSCTGCHLGSVSSDTAMYLDIIDTATGNDVNFYQPNKTYAIQVGLTKTGIAKMGFALSVNGGTLSKFPADPTVKITNGYATHTSDGTSTEEDEGYWDVLWKAPASGNVNFQLFINATNNDNASSGDMIYGATKALQVNSVREIEQASFHVFPNPAQNELTLSLINANNNNIKANLIGLDGKQTNLYNGVANQNIKLDISTIETGVYFLQVISNDAVSTQKVFIQ